MDAKSFIDAIVSKYVNVAEIRNQAESLKSSDVLISFLNNSPLNVSPSQVQIFLMETSIKMIDKKVPMQLVKNIYNEYSVIFAIAAMQKTNSPAIVKKLQAIFKEIILNSATFDIYYKKNIKAKRIVPTMPMEFYWLIPLLQNPVIFKSVNYIRFIEENIEIATAVSDYCVGYEYYIENLVSFDKNEYKLFLKEGVTAKNRQAA